MWLSSVRNAPLNSKSLQGISILEQSLQAKRPQNQTKLKIKKVEVYSDNSDAIASHNSCLIHGHPW